MKATPRALINVVLSVLLVGIVIFFYYGQLYDYYLELPDGCDEFGHLDLSKAVTQGKLFQDHASRPFDNQLIPYLTASSHAYRDYGWLIAPHAHHLDQATHKVINQYPPGVGMLLSVLPLEVRRGLYPVLCIGLFMLFVLAALMFDSRSSLLEGACLVTLMAALLFVFPKFREVNSVAPTYGLLLAAGFLLKNRPSGAILLLGLSCLFRVSNLLFFPFFAAVFVFWRFWGNRDADPGVGRRYQGWIGRAVAAVLLLLLGGLGAHFVYVTLLLGNPFLPTYSLIDQASTPAAALLDHLLYYLHWTQPWVWIHLAVLGLSALLWRRSHLAGKWLALGLLMSVANYAFFIFHEIKVTHYPYASAIICMGILLKAAESIVWGRAGRRVLFTAAAVTSLAFVAVTRVPAINIKQNFIDQVKAYNAALGRYDVVWADEKSGTVGYATGKAGFRYRWGSRAARQDVVGWLDRHGYSQAFWINDLGLTVPAVADELRQLKIAYTIRQEGKFGALVETGRAGARPVVPDKVTGR